MLPLPLPENTKTTISQSLILPLPQAPEKKLSEYEHFSLSKCDIREKNILEIVDKLKKLPKANKKLSRRDQVFADLWLAATPTKLAATKAGYGGKTIADSTRWLLSDPKVNRKIHVFLYIFNKLQKNDTRTSDIVAAAMLQKKIDASYDAHFVAREIVTQYKKANGELPVEYVKDKLTGDDVPVYKHNPVAALKSLELLGKHKNVKAFDNTIEHKSSDLANLLATIRQGYKPPALANSGAIIDVTPSSASSDS